MKKLSLILVALFFTCAVALAQKAVTGNVTDANGDPLIGATVIAKGTTTGTLTDIDGNFKLNVPAGVEDVVISFTGFDSVTANIANTSSLLIKLSEGKLIDEVVVTALGIERDERSLGYSSQEVSGDEFTRVKDANFLNSMSGKVSGVNIKSSGTFGGSTNVVIRGYKSLTGNNQALFVVDGVPISNAITNTAGQTAGRAGYDFGNAASDINPEDIESINVLKGAAASALYGSRAANGVVLITTKKGKKQDGVGISFNTGVTVGTIDPSTMPKYQFEYGPGYTTDPADEFYEQGTRLHGLENYDINGDGTSNLAVVMYEDASYGPKYDPSIQVYDWRSIYPELDSYNKTFPYEASGSSPLDFYETGLTFNNSISVDGGTDRANFRLGYTNFNSKGVLPNSQMGKNTVALSAGYDILDNWKIGAAANVVLTSTRGRFGTGYDSNNINQTFRQWFQTGVSIQDMKDTYEQTGKNISWNPFGQLNPSASTQPHYSDNSYYMRNENFTTDGRNRLFGNVFTTYEFTDNLSVTGRVSLDSYDEVQEQRIAYESVDVAKYARYNRTFRETNTDVYFNYDNYFGSNNEIGFKAIVGTNIRRVGVSTIRAETNGGIFVPGVYSLNNSVAPIIAPTESQFRQGINGYYTNLSFDYNRFLYLDVTGRYDISSTLPAGNNSYFYPSASLSLVFSELMDSDALSFGKLRLNFAQVGNDAPALSLVDYYVLNTPFNGIALASYPSTENNADLRPEITTNVEAGVDLRFLRDRLRLDVGVYRSVTNDLITPVDLSKSTGLYRKFFNAGSLENKGLEITLGFVPVRTGDFTWDVNVNWSANRNQVLELYEGLDRLELAGVQGGIRLVAEPGSPYGSILGSNFVYDSVSGEPVVIANPFGGMRHAKSGAPEIIGDIQADWRAGINNAFTYKGLRFSFLIDMQKGGDFFSLDTWYGNATGMYANSAGLNDKGNPVRAAVEDGGGRPIGGVTRDGTPNEVYGFAGSVYSSFGYVFAPNAYHVYDASFVKLRELALGYTFNLTNDYIKSVGVDITGKNLWIIHKNSEYSDPEAGLSAGNIQGYQSGAYPSCKRIRN